MARRRRGYPRNPKILKSLYSADRSSDQAKRWQFGAEVGEDAIKKLDKLRKLRKSKGLQYDRITKWLKEKNLTDSSIMPSFNEFVRDENPLIPIKGIPFNANSLYQASYLGDPLMKKINDIFEIPDPTIQAVQQIKKDNPDLLKVGP